MSHQTQTQASSAPPVKALIKAKRLGAALALSERAVCHLAQNGKIPGHKIGGVWRFDLEEVLNATKR